MYLLINHLTRMRPGFMCTAGIDLATGRHVRPVVRKQLGTELLARHGGPFDIAALVELGPTLYAGQRPEVEDYRFNPKKAVRKGTASASFLWGWLERLARPKLVDLFGPELTCRGARSCAVDLHRGKASLGCLASPRCEGPYLAVRPDRTPQVRLRVSDGAFDLDLGVTDVRLYGPDHVTPDEAAVGRVRERLQAGEPVILCAGLTRPPPPMIGQPQVHWLQVNNFHFNDQELWQLG